MTCFLSLHISLHFIEWNILGIIEYALCFLRGWASGFFHSVNYFEINLYFCIHQYFISFTFYRVDFNGYSPLGCFFLFVCYSTLGISPHFFLAYMVFDKTSTIIFFLMMRQQKSSWEQNKLTPCNLPPQHTPLLLGGIGVTFFPESPNCLNANILLEGKNNRNLAMARPLVFVGPLQHLKPPFSFPPPTP